MRGVGKFFYKELRDNDMIELIVYTYICNVARERERERYVCVISNFLKKE